jgi:hypothetical protein
MDNCQDAAEHIATGPHSWGITGLWAQDDGCDSIFLPLLLSSFFPEISYEVFSFLFHVKIPDIELIDKQGLLR